MNQVSRCQPLLGTYVDITISGEASEETLHSLCNDAYEAIFQVQELLSFHDPESQLSKINNLPVNTPLAIHPWTFEVLETALQISDLTQGVYDVTIGSTMVRKNLLPNIHKTQLTDQGNWQDIHLKKSDLTIQLDRPVTIDLGGIAKGFAVDKALTSIKSAQLKQAIINAGGDIKMLHPEGETIHIRAASGSNLTDHDFIKQPMLDHAVATSSNTFAPNHEPSYIIDPRNHECIIDSRSISIFAPDCITADALTKAAFLLSKETLDSLLKYYKASAVIIP